MSSTHRATELAKPIEYMDDYCKQENVFLSTDDKIKFTVDKSRSHFRLFQKTVNSAFQHVKVYPDVPGLDVLMEDTKRKSQQ